ncbi:acyltransferase [Bacteroides fluxus]|uniref:Conserved domain protein n=1 Tax=Bacteroides fluxus YIT 12057 TaxID=763034 RepID=F3PP24_9BACE|nr:hypothetical protein [Bacteroides fluxus]EGF59392.1 conserved domain protein [Bacteroides fluxus YIT 12057]
MKLKNTYRKFRHWIGVGIRVHWLKTFYLNFKLLPINQAIHFPFVVVGKVHLRSLIGKVEFQCPVCFGTVIIGKDVDNMPISYMPAQIFLQGKLVVKGTCIINQSASVVVWPQAVMELGEGVLICSGVLLKAVHHVTVGKYAMISSGCFIMDSNIHCIRDTETGVVSNPTQSIQIGDYCWLSMNTSILGGGELPNCSITTRYALLNKAYGEADSGCIFAGMPAKIVRRNKQRVISFEREREITQYFIDNPEAKTRFYFKGIEEISKNELKDFFSC